MSGSFTSNTVTGRGYASLLQLALVTGSETWSDEESEREGAAGSLLLILRNSSSLAKFAL